MALPTKLANNTRRLGLLMEMVSTGAWPRSAHEHACALYTRSYLPSCARRKPMGNTIPSLRYFEMIPSSALDCLDDLGPEESSCCCSLPQGIAMLIEILAREVREKTQGAGN